MSTGRNNQGGERRELVFCHECENEWYNEPNSLSNAALTCPACQSDFTEIIDQDFDPRAAQTAESILQSHNPWADDPDEDDIGAIDDEQFGPRGQDHTTFQHDPNQHPLIPGLMNIFQGITGMRGGYPGFDAGNHGPQQNEGRPQSAPGMPQAGPGGAPPRQPGVWQYQYNAPGVHISVNTSTHVRGRDAQNRQMPAADINEILQGLGLFGGMTPFGPMPGGRGQGPPGGVPHPFAGLFGGMFDPANARSGDAVFSQEALDRVISQLMEQNPHGNAPPPAPASAIHNLPRKKLTVDMLDENTGQANCSICMDDVEVGTEITTLPCNHWFHFECVEAWLKEHDTCPVCRRGILAKDGPKDRPRNGAEEPLHDADPAMLARQQSGSRDNPFVVDESPTRDRRQRPPERRHSSHGGESSSGPGITDRVRNFFGGGGSGSSS